MRRFVIQTGFWIFLVVFVSWAFFGLMRSFVEPILWAVTLAVVFHPVYRRLRDRFGGRESLASTLTTLLIFFAVLLPIAGILAAMVNEGVYLYEQAQQGQVQQVLQQLQARLPRFQGLLDRFGLDVADVQTRVQNAVGTAGQRIVGTVGAAVSNAAGVIISFFVMLYLIYFFLKDGYRILGKVIEVLPLGDEHEWNLLKKFGSTARATIKGSVVVGAVQGLIGGIAFAVLGIHGPVFWGVLMAVSSLIPSVGTALVWAPAAIYFFATGDTVKAVVLVVIGGGVISMVDNVLRPLLVGRDTGVPDWIVLLVSFGGIAVFGLSGLVIGPVVAALFLTVWDQFAKEFDYGEDMKAAVVARAQGIDPATLRKNRDEAPPAAMQAAWRAAAQVLEAASAAEVSRSTTTAVVAGTALDAAHAKAETAAAAASDVATQTAETADAAGDSAQKAEAVADMARDAHPEMADAADRAADAAEEAASLATDTARTASDAAETADATADDVQISAEFIRQQVEGTPSPELDLDALAAETDLDLPPDEAGTGDPSSDTAERLKRNENPDEAPSDTPPRA